MKPIPNFLQNIHQATVVSQSIADKHQGWLDVVDTTHPDFADFAIAVHLVDMRLEKKSNWNNLRIVLGMMDMEFSHYFMYHLKDNRIIEFGEEYLTKLWGIPLDNKFYLRNDWGYEPFVKCFTPKQFVKGFFLTKCWQVVFKRITEYSNASDDAKETVFNELLEFINKIPQ